MKVPNQRQLRAGELVRRAVSELLAEGQIKDPAVIGRTLTITEARMSPDLRYATVFTAAMGEPAGPAVTALNRASGFIQRELGRMLELRYTPKLTFEADDRFDQADHIDEVLARPGVKRDLGALDEGEGEGGGER